MNTAAEQSLHHSAACQPVSSLKQLALSDVLLGPRLLLRLRFKSLHGLRSRFFGLQKSNELLSLRNHCTVGLLHFLVLADATIGFFLRGSLFLAFFDAFFGLASLRVLLPLLGLL